MRARLNLLLAILACCAFAHASAQGLADEERDYGLPAQAELRLDDYSAPTPLEIPGARRVTSEALLRHLAATQGRPDLAPFLFDVLGGAQHESLPGAIWLPGAGRGRSFGDPLQAQIERVLQLVTGGARGRPLVFFCASKNCWLSYNTALRAARLGYTEVYWYRGGIEAWLASGQVLAPLKVSWQRPATE